MLRCLRALGLLPPTLLSACSTTALLDSGVPQDSYVSRPWAAYGPDPRQRLDIYLPLPWSASAGQHPLVTDFVQAPAPHRPLTVGAK